MPRPFDRSSHKLRKRQQLLDELPETARSHIPTKDIEMTTVTERTITTITTITGATTTIVAITTITEVTTIAATTTTVATTITIGRRIIVVTIIATTITRTDGTQEITKGTTGRKTYARSDEDYPTTIAEGHAPHGLNHHVPRSNKNDNWYR